MWTTWAACLREQSHSLPVFWRPQIPKFKRFYWDTNGKQLK